MQNLERRPQGFEIRRHQKQWCLRPESCLTPLTRIHSSEDGCRYFMGRVAVTLPPRPIP